jgi:hypothetical protein
LPAGAEHDLSVFRTADNPVVVGGMAPLEALDTTALGRRLFKQML